MYLWLVKFFPLNRNKNLNFVIQEMSTLIYGEWFLWFLDPPFQKHQKPLSNVLDFNTSFWGMYLVLFISWFSNISSNMLFNCFWFLNRKSVQKTIPYKSLAHSNFLLHHLLSLIQIHGWKDHELTELKFHKSPTCTTALSRHA